MDLCRADGRPYGVASNGWGPGVRVAAAVPLGDSLTTHLFEGFEVPRALSTVLDRILNAGPHECTVGGEGPGLPTDFDASARTVGASYVYGRNDAGEFVRRDSLRVVPTADPAALVVDMRGTILGGQQAGQDGRWVADQVRLVTAFDTDIRASAPPSEDAHGLAVQRSVDEREDAVEHRFTPTSDRPRKQFTGCQRSLVRLSEIPKRFSYTANARFRWRDPRFIRDDGQFTHHTPGLAMWYPSGR